MAQDRGCMGGCAGLETTTTNPQPEWKRKGMDVDGSRSTGSTETKTDVSRHSHFPKKPARTPRCFCRIISTSLHNPPRIPQQRAPPSRSPPAARPPSPKTSFSLTFPPMQQCALPKADFQGSGRGGGLPARERASETQSGNAPAYRAAADWPRRSSICTRHEHCLQ